MAARHRVADRRRDLPVRDLGDPVPARVLRVRAGARGARLARDQRLDRRAVDPGHRLRPAPRPRLRAGRRRDPPVGLRPRRHRPADRGDGRRRARGRRRGPHRGAGRADPGRGRPRGRGRARRRRGDPRRAGCSRTPTRRRPSSAWSSEALLPERFARRAARLPLRGHQREDQPRGRPAADGGGDRRQRRPALPPRDRRDQPDDRRDGRGAGRGAGRPSRAAIRTSSSACRPSTIRRWHPRESTWSRSTSTHSPTRSPRAPGTSIRDEVADRAIAKIGELLPQPARLDPRAPGARAARPRARARDLGRPRAARRDGLRPALQPAPGARLGRVPHADPGPLALRRRHPPRRRRDRRQRAQLRPRGASASTTSLGARLQGPRDEPALSARVGRDRGARRSRSSRPGPRSREILERIGAHRLPGPRRRPDAARAGRRSAAGPSPTSTATSTSTAPRPRPRCRSAPAAPELLEPAIEALRAIRQRGQPRARLRAHRRARRAAAGGRAGERSPATTSPSTAPRRSRSRSR